MIAELVLLINRALEHCF